MALPNGGMAGNRGHQQRGVDRHRDRTSRRAAEEKIRDLERRPKRQLRGIDRRQIVIDAGPAAQHGLGIAGELIGEAETRGKIIIVAIVYGRTWRAQGRGGDVIQPDDGAEAAVRLVRHRVELISQAEVELQPGRDPDVVLAVKSEIGESHAEIGFRGLIEERRRDCC